jgi:hypothetical protein
LDGPFVVLFEQQGPDETDDGFIVGEDANDLGAPLDLAVEALDRVVLWSLARCSLGKLI